MSYQPLDLTRVSVWIGFHMAGLALDTESQFVSGIHLSRIPWTEWGLVERREIVEECAGPFMQTEHIFACFGYGDPGVSGSALSEFVQSLRQMASERVRLLVWALRLYKSGTLIDPHHSVIYTRSGALNSRAPGLYRHRLLEDATAQYKLPSHEVADVERLVGLLSVYEAYGEHLGVDIGLRAFNLSYTPYLRPAQRLVFLYTALEAVYGEYRKRPRGVSLGSVAAVLAPPEEATSVREYLDREGRALRNHVSHGSTTATDVDEDEVVIIEGAVRVGLRALVDFAVRFRTFEDDIADSVRGMDGQSPTQSFVALLAAAALGEPAGLEILARRPEFDHGL
jgi:hypothetical protein